MTRTWVEGAAAAGLLNRERTIARPGFNRWLVPPAALAIHLSIGMAYGFSVFWLPMGRLLPVAPRCHAGFMAELTATSCNWTVPTLTPIFEIFIALLGLSAAVFGGWVERVGPRASGFVAAVCWGGGLLIGAAGVAIHQLWLVFLGVGVIGGIGQGLGYITPVTTLVRWFPDRRGMATGFAIMGYGGGAMIGSPLAVWLMDRFSGDGSPGVAPALAAMGAIYLVAMSLGAFGFRVLPSDRLHAAPVKTGSMITLRHVHFDQAWKTRQFWMLWLVLCANVTAGIALISMASPMFQDVFGARLAGLAPGVEADAAQGVEIAAAAAGLVGLISLFNSLGRLFWASVSDHLGRKATYAIFLALGAALFACLPTLAHLGLAAAFVGAVCLIIAMYGGGYSTLPAYLADIFGTRFVGAIHGRVLTAWSVAGVVGPALIASLRQSQLQAGLPKTQIYDLTLYLMAGVLVVGFVCNLLVRPVADTHFLEDLAAPEAAPTCDVRIAVREDHLGVMGALAWLAVAIPFLIGLYIALQKAAVLL